MLLDVVRCTAETTAYTINSKRLLKVVKCFAYNKNISYICGAKNGTVAQWINAPGYGPGDWGFESLRYHRRLDMKMLSLSFLCYEYICLIYALVNF